MIAHMGQMRVPPAVSSRGLCSVRILGLHTSFMRKLRSYEKATSQPWLVVDFPRELRFSPSLELASHTITSFGTCEKVAIDMCLTVVFLGESGFLHHLQLPRQDIIPRWQKNDEI